jgi:hypothetical protein
LLADAAEDAVEDHVHRQRCEQTPKRKCAQLDFAWSFACANNIGSNSNPCVPTHTIN